jgi:hypothetical protein
MESKMVAYKLNEEKMFCDIADGVAVIINSETGIYYGMNGFGTNVFENIINQVSMEDILAELKKIEAPADMEKKLKSFINELIKKELVITDKAGKSKVKLDKKIAATDKFILEVTEYSDAQELLLADPIHDIKDETGWKPDKSVKDNGSKRPIKRVKRAIMHGSLAKTEAKPTVKKALVKPAKNAPAKKPVAKPNKKVQK